MNYRLEELLKSARSNPVHEFASLDKKKCYAARDFEYEGRKYHCARGDAKTGRPADLLELDADTAKKLLEQQMVVLYEGGFCTIKRVGNFDGPFSYHPWVWDKAGELDQSGEFARVLLKVRLVKHVGVIAGISGRRNGPEYEQPLIPSGPDFYLPFWLYSETRVCAPRRGARICAGAGNCSRPGTDENGRKHQAPIGCR